MQVKSTSFYLRHKYGVFRAEPSARSKGFPLRIRSLVVTSVFNLSNPCRLCVGIKMKSSVLLLKQNMVY